MAYTPEEREAVIESMKKNIDSMIMLCDDGQDLVALASIMAVTSKNLFLQQLGKKGASNAFRKILEVIDE